MFRNILFSLSFLVVSVSVLYAQQAVKLNTSTTSLTCKPTPIYENFNQTSGNWMRNNVNYSGSHVYPSRNSTPGKSGAPDDRALEGFDKPGTDRLFNQIDYSGNILGCENYLCFDFKVLNSFKTKGVQPTVYFYQGDLNADPPALKRQVIFKSSKHYTHADGWVRICIPLHPAIDSLPNGTAGSWSIRGRSKNTTQDVVIYNKVMTNLNGIYFWLDLNRDDPRERYVFDNVCFKTNTPALSRSTVQ